MKRSIFIALLLIQAVAGYVPVCAETTDDDYVVFAKSLPARDYEQSLPPMTIEQWLNTAVQPYGITAVWGNHVTDCGEQTGDPALDKGRDMPLCVEIELIQKDEPVGYLTLFVGTAKKGRLEESVGLYAGFIRRGDKTIWLNRLGELANAVKDQCDHD